MHSRAGCRTLGAPIQTIQKDPAVFMFFFLRFKYGPLVIVLAGVALMTIAAGVTHHLATGIAGAVLVVTGAAAGVTRKRRGTPAGDPDEAPRAMSRSAYKRRPPPQPCRGRRRGRSGVAVPSAVER
jgi:hypothetical protein